MIALALAAVLSAAPGEGWPRVVSAVEIKGTAWTRREVVLRELPFREGERVSRAAWELGISRLWNMGIFSRVDAALETRGGAEVAVLTLEERISLNPLVSFGVGGGAWWFRVGATDNNFLGTFLEWGARYERFGAFNGAQGWVRDPRLFGKRLDGLVQLDFLMRPRPGYTRRRLSGTVELGGELSDDARLTGRVELFHDWYFAPAAGEARVPVELTAGVGSLGLSLGRLDIERLRQRGLSFGLEGSVGATGDAAAPMFAQLFLELLYFVPFGERWNLAVRGQAGHSTAAPPELLYHLGGLDLVRGYADSLVRTRSYALANVELRFTVFDSTWFALVAAAFVDGAVTQEAGARALLSTGAGVRLLVPRFVRTGIRADFALALAGRVEPGISLGVFQFF